jgi:signal transduction histidine kinase/CheY-like chemotaxis protein
MNVIKRIFRPVSRFRSKQRLGIMMACSIVLIATLFSSLAYNYYSFKRESRDRLITLADIIGADVGAALAFGDKQAVAKSLEPLRADPSVKLLFVLDMQEQISAYYHPDADAAPADLTQHLIKVRSEAEKFTFNFSLEVERPIIWGGVRLGTILIEQDEHTFTKKLSDSAGIGVFILLLALGFSYLLAEQLQKTQEEIIAEKNKAEAASKAKTQFLAKMSHEIRTPMNGVIGLLGLLKDAPLAAEQLKMIRMAHESAEKLLGVINDILDFSKIEAGKLEIQSQYFTPRDLVNDVLNMYWLKVQNNSIKLVSTIDDSVPVAVKGDKARLRQVLINLIGNAIKFTERGEVFLGLALAENTSSHSVLRFEVRDTGSGISPDRQMMIFDPFSQGDDSMSRRYEGTGLGLTISKELVEAMGGHIGFLSELDKGSLFWFTVKVQNTEFIPAPVPLIDKPIEIIEQHDKEYMPRILLAEDNPVNQVLGRMVLESFDCEVDEVWNGREAVKAVFNKDYDLVLMDCQMPEVDGYEATRIIRQRESECNKGKRRTYIVALTANSMDGDRELCLGTGMDDYISKPFKPHQIQTLLERCCG